MQRDVPSIELMAALAARRTASTGQPWHLALQNMLLFYGLTEGHVGAAAARKYRAEVERIANIHAVHQLDPVLHLICDLPDKLIAEARAKANP